MSQDRPPTGSESGSGGGGGSGEPVRESLPHLTEVCYLRLIFSLSLNRSSSNIIARLSLILRNFRPFTLGRTAHRLQIQIDRLSLLQLGNSRDNILNFPPLPVPQNPHYLH